MAVNLALKSRLAFDINVLTIPSVIGIVNTNATIASTYLFANTPNIKTKSENLHSIRLILQAPKLQEHALPSRDIIFTSRCDALMRWHKQQSATHAFSRLKSNKAKMQRAQQIHTRLQGSRGLWQRERTRRTTREIEILLQSKPIR
jgi:hypothetical protein